MDTQRTTETLVQAVESERGATQRAYEDGPSTGHSSPWIWIAPVLFGLIWLVDAYLKWQPGFQNHFLDIMSDGAKDQPGWLMPWFDFWHATVAPYAHFCALCAALTESFLAFALIVGFARKVTYILGALWSLGIWAVPEGFGHEDMAMSTDIGT